MLTQARGRNWSRRAVPIALAAAALAASALGCTRDALAPRWTTAEEAVARIGATTVWSPAVRIEAAWPGAHPNFNTPALDGCPASSRDGKTFFLASTRPGSRGIDIWVSHRARFDEPWG